MKKDVTRDLALTANFLSLVAGGMSMPKVMWRKAKTHYQLEINVPGVNPDQYSLDIVNRALMVFQNHDLHTLNVPHLVHSVNIPAEVELNEIKATYVGKTLKITLPFNEYAGGYQRHIDIDPEY